MKTTVIAVLIVLLSAGVALAVTPETQAVCDWSASHLNIIFDVLKRGASSPPAVGRSLAIHMACVWDSVAPYTDTWTPIYENGIERKPPSERTDANRMLAASKASYSAFLFMHNASCFDCPSLAAARQKLQSHSLDPDYDGTDVTSPSGVANVACSKIFQARRLDGSNQFGDEYGSLNNAKPFSDYSNFVPVNPPTPEPASGQDPITDCAALKSLNRWQPLTIRRPDGTFIRQSYAVPHWSNVVPFGMKSASQFRPPPPPMLNTRSDADFRNFFKEVLDYSARLDDRMKAITEYWADGPESTSPPGHWHQVAIDMAVKYNLGLLDTIGLLFVNGQAMMDAGIAAWDAKRFYDSVRPITAIQCLFAGQTGKAWLGPYQGVGDRNLSTWQPYQFKTFVTPPFSEYVSGHSTFSAAAAEAMKLFLGTDTYGLSFTMPAGKSLYEPKITDTANPDYRAGVTDVANTGPGSIGYSPATDVVLSWPTFSAAAEEAGISRLYGGIHVHAGNVEGLALGRKIGQAVYDRWRSLAGRGDGTTANSGFDSSTCLNTDKQLEYSIIGGVVGVAGTSLALLLLGLLIYCTCLRDTSSRPAKKDPVVPQSNQQINMVQNPHATQAGAPVMYVDDPRP